MMRLSVTALILICLLTITSISWCATTWHDAGHFIFLPGGDVGLGFASHHGALQWVEHAPWDQQHPYYAIWSLPWAVIIALEVMLAGACIANVVRLRRRRGRGTTDAD